MKMKESLESSRIWAEQKEEKKECRFHKLPAHRHQMILNASAKPPFSKQANSPTDFYNIIITETSAFKAKQLIDYKLSVSSAKRFKVSPALAASIWIGDLITDELSPSNLSIWFCPERTHTDSKESNFERGIWILDGKHIRSDIHLLSKTSIHIPDGIMDAYFMIFNFHSIFELDIFLNEWLEHIFTNRQTYIIQHDDDRTFLAQVLHCINQAVHLYLDSCSKNCRLDVCNDLLSHNDKRDLIEQRNFTQKLPNAIKKIFTSTDDENIEKEGGAKENLKVMGAKKNSSENV